MLPDKKKLLEEAKEYSAVNAGILYPHNVESLAGAFAAYEEGLINPVFIGNKQLILEIADKEKINIYNFYIIDVNSEAEAVKVAKELVESSKLDILVKGSLNSDVLLKELFINDFVEHRTSHVALMFEEGKYPYLLTDSAVNLKQSYKVRAVMRKNAEMIYQQLTGITALEQNIVMPSCMWAANKYLKNAVSAENALFAGIVVGLKVPLVLTSKGHGLEIRTLSCALAVVLANR